MNVMKKNSKKVNCPLCQNLAMHEMSSNDLMFKKNKIYDYYFCRLCDLTFINPLPNLVEIKNFYPDSYMVFEPARLKKINIIEKVRLQAKHGYMNLINKDNYLFNLLGFFLLKSREHIDYVESGKFLDIGCGNGSRLLKMRNLGWQVTGVELNKKAFNECVNHNLNVFNSTLENTKFEDNSFDVVYMSHLVEHLANPCEIFEIVNKILKPNGLLYIKTPNRNSLGRKIFGKYWYANDIPRHLFLFSKKSLVNVFKKLNMNLVYYSQDTTPKIFLNSIDYFFKLSKPSKRNKIFRILSKLYVFPAKVLQKGDESFFIFKKN